MNLAASLDSGHPELGPIVTLGIAGDGSVEVPQDGHVVGWFDRSAVPGAQGPMAIAAHATGTDQECSASLATSPQADRGE